MSGEGASALRLLAMDAEDFELIAAALRDAVVHPRDISWERRARRLTLRFERVRWEGEAAPPPRTAAALQLGCVTRVRARDLGREALLLLGVGFRFDDPPGGAVTFAFAGGGALLAEVECIDAALADLAGLKAMALDGEGQPPAADIGSLSPVRGERSG